MEIKLKSDRKELSFNVPEESFFYRPKEFKNTIDKSAFIKRLVNTINRSSSGEIKNCSVAIVVSDKTRLSEFSTYMPWIEEALGSSKIDKPELRFFIAYGSHPQQTEAESKAIYGDYYNKYEFIHHDARSGDFQDFGTTTHGTRVQINGRVFSENDLVITYGSITHHYFAGFGGGRKLIFPGLAKYSSILHNHSLFLDFENKNISQHCQSGLLKGNPVAEDLKEIYDMLPETVGIHAILNQEGKVAAFEIGNDYETFEKACETYAEYYQAEPDAKHDLVLASTGGFPKDINFIQAHKSIHTAAGFVRDNGKLVILAECPNGMGNNQLTDIFRRKAWNKIFPENREQYLNNTGTALAHLKKTKRIEIYMITSLSDEICKLLSIQKIERAGVQKLLNSISDPPGILENASLIY